MKKRYWLATVTAVALLFFQCQKDLSYIGSRDLGTNVSPDPITTSIQGNIIDENEQAAAGVMVTAGTSTALTDANGYFHIYNAKLDKNTTLVTAQKAGYFKGYRVLAATGGCNQVIIKLVKKVVAGTIKSAAGGEVSLSNGMKVSLPANGVVTASSGSAYRGDVTVNVAYINPRQQDIAKTVPGSFVANDKNGKRVLLTSYGMVAVELSSASGEKLQIKNGSVAKLTIPVPPSALAAAPATIALWYVDETTGIWKEEGTATKQGNNYVGDVKHFSFWNCDAPMDAVNLSITLHTADDAPLVYASVRITATYSNADSSYSSSAYGYTDSLGAVKGLVPANKNLQLQVLDQCGNVVYSKDIQPLSKDEDLGAVKVALGTQSYLTIQGSLLTCAGEPVTHGYAVIDFNNSTRYVATDMDGKFSISYLICSGSPSSATILGVDEDNQQQGDPVTVTATYPNTNTGNIVACGGAIAGEFIKYTLDNENHYIVSFNKDSTFRGGTYSGSTLIGTYHDNGVAFVAQGATDKGTYPIVSLELTKGPYVTSKIVDTAYSTATFTNFPEPQQFYEGTFKIKYTDSIAVHNISGSFKVRRQ